MGSEMCIRDRRIGDTIAILRDGAVIQQGDPQDIIMHPSDDYIVDFIQDINRGRVIRLRTLMTAGTSIQGLALNENMVLEEALPLVADTAEKACNVVDDNNNILGSIDLNQIISGLARPKVETNP